MVVGVVGIGHVDGITQNWDKEIDVKELLRYSARKVLGSTICSTHFTTLGSRRPAPPRWWDINSQIHTTKELVPFFTLKS